MRQIYLDLGSGVAGDMLVAGLLDAGAPETVLRAALAGLPPEFRWERQRVRRHGLVAERFVVECREDGPARHLAEVLAALAALELSDRARRWAVAAFEHLAAAEARCHGCSVEDVHFHEVGAVDALVDVAGACALLDALAPDAVWISPIGLGSGTVASAHGVLPVPAPATLELLRGLPVGGHELAGERATPTGAALLRAWEVRHGGRPAAIPLACGHGAGARDPEDRPNFLRVIVEEAEGRPERLIELRALVDDLSGELLGAALDACHAAGALEAFAVPALAKKGRPAYEVVVLAEEAQREEFVELLFRQLGTLGMRVASIERRRRPRRVVERPTALGPMPFKERLGPAGVVDAAKPEFDALRRRATELGLTPREALDRLAVGEPPRPAPGVDGGG